MKLYVACAVMLISVSGGLPRTESHSEYATGKAVFDGKLVDLPPINMTDHPECAKLNAESVPSQAVVIGDDRGLANVFVQVKNVPAGDYEAPADGPVIDQQGCIYVPSVAGVMVNQPLGFKNSDGILHNVHGLPDANKEFNIDMPPAVKESSVTLAKPEQPFEVKCDVHPWMTSYLAVMTHPYWAVTDTDGAFKIDIDGLPKGTYEVEAWHATLGTQTTKITVGETAPVVNFAFK